MLSDPPSEQPPPQTSDDDTAYQPSPVSANPPMLPPIPRVALQFESNGEIETEKLDERTDGGLEFHYQHSERRGFKTSRSALDSKAQDNPIAKEVSEQHQYQMLEDASLPRPIISPEQSRYVLQEQESSRITGYEVMRSYSEPRNQPRPDPIHPIIPSPPQPQRNPPPPPYPTQHSFLKITPPELPNTNASDIRHSKSKLNLLNPLSLLAKRRSSRAMSEIPFDRYSQYKKPLPAGSRLPDDYDPRIRGKVIHDFSAPRPRSKASKQQEPYGLRPPKLSPNSSASLTEDDSPSSTEREHTPVFKEHFEDDVEPWKDGQDGPTKRRASAFLYQVSLANSQPNLDPSTLPPFARNLPPSLSTNSTAARQVPSPPSRQAPSPPRPPLEAVSEATARDSAATRTSLSSPPKSPPLVRAWSTSNSDSSFQPAGLPKHLKSNASRFSFDLAGVGSSAQEKILEEKHRQKARQKARASETSDRSTNDRQHDDRDEEGYDDYDDMEDDGAFEESIPGVDADIDSIGNPVSMHTLDGGAFVSPSKSSFTGGTSPMSTENISADTSRDKQSQISGFAPLEFSPTFEVCHDSADGQRSQEHGPDLLRRINLNNNSHVGVHSHPFTETQSPIPPLQQNYEDDDLYFDDGIIEDLNETGGEVFDESVFDDETSRVYGLPLRDLKPLGASNSISTEMKHRPPPSDLSSDQATLNENDSSPDTQRGIPNFDFASLESRNSVIGLPHVSRPGFSQAAGLTQDNLLAYHDALAFAANQAALNGQFVRRPSDLDSSPDMIADESRPSKDVDGLLNDVVEDADDFDYDDTLADDPIVAAANAEALENDDEGFYGQEFGFFARAGDSSEAQYANGGYFGPRGIEGLSRSRSGRVNLQEPSLTPITERSEWSNRNSAISLAMHGYAPQALGTSGLAQLTDMMHLDEGGDMSLSALMKLRRGAWGGSNASLQSSSSGSPLNFLPPTLSAAASYYSDNASPIDGHNGFTTSNHSLSNSQNIGTNSGDASPSSTTITLSTMPEGLLMAAPYMQADRSHSPVKRMPPTKSGHSRNSSGAESVSYVKETSEEGGRWVLEKRRTIEGQVEILGREVVEGGRI